MTQVPREGRRTISTAVLLLLGTIVTTLASFACPQISAIATADYLGVRY